MTNKDGRGGGRGGLSSFLVDEWNGSTEKSLTKLNAREKHMIKM